MQADDSNRYDPIKHKYAFVLSDLMFALVFLTACLFEANLIRHLWIRPKYSTDALTASLLQFEVLMPALIVLALRLAIGKQMKKGAIGPSFAYALCLNLAVLIMFVYMAFAQFLDLVPR